MDDHKMHSSKKSKAASALLTGFARLSAVPDKFGNIRDFLFTQASPSFEKFLPFRRTSIVGRTLTEIFRLLAGSQDDRLPMLIQAALQYGNVEFDLYFARQQRWVNVIAFCDEQQTMSLILYDRTIQKNAELLLNDEAQKMRQLFNSNTATILRL